MKKILVKEYVGSNAISMNSGGKLKDAIIKEWDLNDKITIDFSEIDVFASPFFNASVGALLKNKTIEELQAKLVFKDISEHGRRLLNLVISNAIKFYSDQGNKTGKGLDKANKEV